MDNRLERFGDLLALYDLGAASNESIVAAAADVVAQGFEGPRMVALASQPSRGPWNVFAFASSVAEARVEVGMSPLDDVAAAVRATQGQIRRWRAGALSDAEFLSFAHWFAGDATPDLAHLKSLFVWMEGPDYARKEPSEVHEQIQAVADRIAQTTDPWPGGPSQ